MGKDSIELIEELSNAPGAPGFEDKVLKIIRKSTKDLANVEEDSMRNLYLYRKNHSGKKPICVLDGHSDEVAFMVQSLLPSGMISFLALGGWSPLTLLGHKVLIQNSEGDYIPGVFASKPPHFMTEEEKGKIIQIPSMVIDVGATSYDELVQDYKIELAAPVVPAVDFAYDEKHHIMMGKAFDNRLGCAAVIDILKNIKDMDLPIDVVGVISSQEEIGTRGSVVSARRVEPQVAIVLEGTPADDTWPADNISQSVVKKGPQIRHRDGSMIANPRWIKYAKEVAKKENVPFQEAVRRAGGTNGGKIHLSGRSVPSLVLGTPVRYAHSHHSISSFDDYENCVKWATEIVKSLTPEDIDKL